MIAQCTSCGNTFETDRFGVQSCPHCGTQVMLEDPNASGAAGAGGAAAGTEAAFAPEAAEGAPIPWERRSELGFVGAFVATWKESLFQPSAFFGRMRTEGTEGVLLYGWLAATIGGVFSGLWGWLSFKLVGSQMLQNPELANNPQFQQIARYFESASGPAGMIAAPISAVVSIFVVAGVVHLGVMMFGANNRGWSATFRSVSFTQGVQLFSVIPFALVPGIGGLIALGIGIWQLVLTVIAVQHTQKTTTGKAALGVIVLPLLLACCLGIVAALGMAAALGPLMKGQ